MAIKKISANLLGNNAVTAASIAGGAISAADIADNSITAAKLSASTSPTFGGLSVSTTANQISTFTSTDANARIAVTDSTDTGYFIVNSGILSIGQSLTTSNDLNIDSSGNVGIGTTSPAYLLHVQKDVDSFVMKVENDGNSPGTAGNSYADASDGLWVDTRWNTATNTPFKVTSNSGNTPMMIIKGDGKVGIGTNSPSYPLTVNGIIECLPQTSDSSEGGEVILRAPTGVITKKRFLLDTFASGTQTVFRIVYEDDSDGANGFAGFVMDSSGNINLGNTQGAGAKLDIGDSTDSVILPKGTTAQRPSSPESGMIRFNTTDSVFETYDGSSWQALKYEVFTATGGTIVTSGGYKYHTFTSSGTFTVSEGSTTVEYLIIAGGGGGGNNHGGGGGAGGLVTGSTTATAGSYTITVGGGGTANNSGSNSSALGATTAVAGGKGGTPGVLPASGGSGGGGGGHQMSSYAGASGTAGQGNDGGDGLDSGSSIKNGGGGGGAGAAGGDAASGSGGNGGNGSNTYSAWASATSTGADSGYYAAGGGGGVWTDQGQSPGSGGLGGGGDGGQYGNVVGGSGVANTGSGGGGGDDGGGSGGAGGSGIVILRYAV